MNSLYVGLCILASYFVGNINWAIIISKLKRKDIRTMGSGNPGTLNMSRNLGLGLGLLTFFLDIMKGAIPVLVSFFLFKNDYVLKSGFILSDFAIYACGLAVVLGHIYPVVFKFKGGKGIASTIGVFIVCLSVQGLSWAMVGIMALVAAAFFIYLTEFGAMGSFIAITPPAIASCICLYLKYGELNSATTILFNMVANLLIFAICFFTWFAHRKNIERMLSGDEHPTSIKAMVVKHKQKKLREKEEQKQKIGEN